MSAAPLVLSPYWVACPTCDAPAVYGATETDFIQGMYVCPACGEDVVLVEVLTNADEKPEDAIAIVLTVAQAWHLVRYRRVLRQLLEEDLGEGDDIVRGVYEDVSIFDEEAVAAMLDGASR